MPTAGLAVRVSNPTHVLMIGLRQPWLAQRGHAKGQPWESWQNPPCELCEVCRRASAARVGEPLGVERLTCRSRRVLQFANRRPIGVAFIKMTSRRTPYRRRGSGGCRIARAATALLTRESPPLYLALHEGYHESLGCLLATHSTTEQRIANGFLSGRSTSPVTVPNPVND